ncbi:sugar ABC transporter ATP-binding protein [Deinococcus sp.]|uniref:sugar ABC transporter ATP-binding protein n=1 Tax=Deinococcus sp. TaxID=47478 RepID=UPI002869D3BD|nr:sugar ABC transporter ATP-binding protein [Deinococcus sp.]
MLLELRAIDKRFPGTHALKAVNLAVEQGTIHAIVGENGAGKSTLIKILTGVYRRDSGEILVDGQPADLQTPLQAQKLGIDAVHQEVVVCRSLSVAENLFLGIEKSRLGLVNQRQMDSEAQAFLDDLGFSISARSPLSSLSVGQQQLVVCAKAVLRGTRLLILDEPTAFLSTQEAEQLERLIRRLHAQGTTFVYISHRMEEIFNLSDTVTVLRDGAVVHSGPTVDVTREGLVSLMAGRDIESFYYKEHIPRGGPLLSAAHLSGPGFQDVNFTVHEGEILGFFGLVGAGRSEVMMSIAGARPFTGELSKGGKKLNTGSVKAALRDGVALIPEDRRHQSLCLSQSIKFNVNLPTYDRDAQGGMVSAAAEQRVAQVQKDSLQIKAPTLDLPTSKLSGGNQQKVVIGKWLNHGADLFMFDEPTTGVDIPTKLEIYRLFSTLVKEKKAILLVSSYLPEVMTISDRLIVMRAGRVVGEVDPAVTSPEDILHLALG